MHATTTLAAEACRLVQDGYEPVLKQTRWCVLKRKANLTGLQHFRLRDLLRHNLKTVRAYDRVPGSGVARGGSPRSPALAGLVSWRLPEG
jgi:hypothetical protein